MDNVAKSEVFEAKLALARPIVTARESFDTREVAFLKIVDAQGREGWGEAAPLPAWGSESFDACVQALRRALQAQEPPRTPAARFAWDVALADIEAQIQGLPLHQFWNPESSGIVEVNGTLGVFEHERDFVAAASVLVNRGFSCLKLKVGVLEPAADLGRIEALLESHPECRLRLDVNGAWDLATTASFISNLGKSQPHIEYIEQPTPDETGWVGLRDSGVAIAADESCVGVGQIERLLDTDSVDVLVLKPMVIGSVARIFEIIGLAGDHDVDVVFTSSIDSALARLALAHLASACGLSRACGLGTGSWLAQDVTTRMELNGSAWVFPEGLGLGLVPDFSGIGLV